MGGAAASPVLSGLEARLKKAFDILGAFPVDLSDKLVPIINLFDADAVGYHTYSGRRFAGQSTVTGAVAGIGKILLRASAEMVVTDHTLGNLAGAAGTFNLRFLGPATTDAFAYTEANSFWLEGIDGVSEFMGASNAVSNDALTPGSILWRGPIPALTTVRIKLPIHLLPGARVLALDETTNQAITYSWAGYVI